MRPQHPSGRPWRPLEFKRLSIPRIPAVLTPRLRLPEQQPMQQIEPMGFTAEFSEPLERVIARANAILDKKGKKHA